MTAAERDEHHVALTPKGARERDIKTLKVSGQDAREGDVGLHSVSLNGAWPESGNPTTCAAEQCTPLGDDSSARHVLIEIRLAPTGGLIRHPREAAPARKGNA